MILRFAQPSDKEALQNLYSEYTWGKLNDVGIPFDKAIFDKRIEGYVKNGYVLLAEIDKRLIGCILGQIVPNVFDKSFFFVSALFYVQPGYRSMVKTIFADLEIILKRVGITKYIVTNPALGEHEKMDRFYRICGFRKLETHYVKDISA